MKELTNLYFPIFYKWFDMTEEFSDAEFGALLRAIRRKLESGEDTDSLPLHIKVACNFIIDGAERVVMRQRDISERGRELAERRWNKGEEKSSPAPSDAKSGGSAYENSSGHSRRNSNQPKFLSFDVDEAFTKAMERSYGKKDTENTKA